MNLKINDDLADILLYLPNSYLVGGCIRDALLGIEPKDWDVEVFGMSYEDLADYLQRFGTCNFVGKQFGTLKLRGFNNPDVEFDFAIARKETKIGIGHTDFTTEFGNVSMNQAARRRDFTINAIYYDPRTNALIDPLDGVGDLSKRILQHTGPAFTEDPLRVLRGMQFAARFVLSTTLNTVELCNYILSTFDTISKERIWMEFEKWASKSTKPSCGLRFLKNTGWLSKFPALHALVDCKQETEHHPEGDVFEHTCMVCDALAADAEWQKLLLTDRAILMLAALTHDIGKPKDTTITDGKITTYGHNQSGKELSLAFLQSIDAPVVIQERVPPLVYCHMYRQLPTAKSVRKLAHKLVPATLGELVLLMKADIAGRELIEAEQPNHIQQIIKFAVDMKLEKKGPEAILLGRHLIDLGMPPGKQFGLILKSAFEEQLEGEFTNIEEALVWLNNNIEILKNEKRK